jgi:hypothetical protein
MVGAKPLYRVHLMSRYIPRASLQWYGLPDIVLLSMAVCALTGVSSP